MLSALQILSYLNFLGAQKRRFSVYSVAQEAKILMEFSKPPVLIAGEWKGEDFNPSLLRLVVFHLWFLDLQYQHQLGTC